VTPREHRAAENEDLFRRLNERLHALAMVAASELDASEAVTSESVTSEPVRERFLCECAQTSCSRVVELTADEYRSVRETNRRFLVFPDASHESPELESTIEQHDRYWIVEKIGDAGVEADSLAERDADPL
jgi:hypothetical protein